MSSPTRGSSPAQIGRAGLTGFGNMRCHQRAQVSKIQVERSSKTGICNLCICNVWLNFLSCWVWQRSALRLDGPTWCWKIRVGRDQPWVRRRYHVRIKYNLLWSRCRHRCQEQGYEFDWGGNGTFSETLTIKCLVNHWNEMCLIIISFENTTFAMNIEKVLITASILTPGWCYVEQQQLARVHTYVRLLFIEIFSQAFTFSESLPYSSNTSKSKQPNLTRLGRYK